jgi:hypothetical protein
MPTSRRDFRRRIGTTLIAGFLVLVSVCTARATAINLEFEYDPSKLSLETSGGFTDVSLPECDFVYRAGAPALPIFAEQLVLPEGTIATAVSAISSRSERFPCGRVRPVQRPSILGLAGMSAQRPVKSEPDPSIYEGTNLFPGDLVSFRGTGRFGEFQVAALEIHPVQYDPVTQEIIIHTRIEVSLELELGPLSWKRQRVPSEFSRSADKIARETMIADEPAPIPPKGYASDIDPDSYQYVIITESAQGSAYTAYSNWKQTKGVPAIVKTVEWIESAYSGRDLQEKIRNFIKDARTQWGTSYVLLGGDIDAVPFRSTWAFDCEAGLHPLENDIPCDLYYSDLDGSWDANANDLFGEVADSIDLYPDVFVGRLPTRNASQATAVLNKLFAYEKTPEMGYTTEAFFFAEVLWNDPFTDSGIGKDMIADRHFGALEPIERQYETLGNETVTSVINYLNWGPHLANHAGHGNQNSLGCANGYLNRSDASALDNGPRYFVLFSIGCWTAAIDYYCIAEDFVNNPDGGAIAYVGNSRYGWSMPGNPGRGYSDLFDSDFYGAIMSEGLTKFGEAISWAKIRRIPYSRDENIYRCHQYQLTLLGDPEMYCHTEEIREISLDVPSSVPSGISHFTASVTDSLGPVEDARLCLSGYGVYQVGITDISGQVVFNLEAPESGILTMTATAPNHWFAQESLPVTSSGAFVTVTSVHADDDSLAPSDGTGDGEISPGETIELRLTVSNCGHDVLNDLNGSLFSEDQFVSISDSWASFGTIDPGGDTTNQSPFVIAVSDSCPSNRVIQFSVRFVDGADTLCTRPLHLEVTSPKPKFRHYYAKEIIGDGDGIVEPEETIELSVAVTNQGTGDLNWMDATLTTLSPTFTVNSSYASADTCVLPGQFSALTPAFEVYVKSSPVQTFYGQFKLDFTHDEGAHSDTFLLGVGTAGLSDDMENGENGWTHSGTQDLWHLSQYRSHSGSKSWYCGNPGSRLYYNNSDASLFSPFFVIPENPRLSFWSYFDIPVYGTDGLYIEIYNYGEWDVLDYLGSGGALDSTLFLCGWAEYICDLSEYPRGSTVRARFRMVSDTEDREEGFYIDDVSVYSASTTQARDLPAVAVPEDVMLSSSWPNPFYRDVCWELALPEPAYVDAGVYDIRGRLVRKLESHFFNSGDHSIVWDGLDNDGKSAASGIYFLEVSANDGRLVRKVVRIRK